MQKRLRHVDLFNRKQKSVSGKLISMEVATQKNHSCGSRSSKGWFFLNDVDRLILITASAYRNILSGISSYKIVVNDKPTNHVD